MTESCLGHVASMALMLLIVWTAKSASRLEIEAVKVVNPTFVSYHSLKFWTGHKCVLFPISAKKNILYLKIPTI